MGLIDKLNDTKLRSLRFGNDRPNGGDSNQPYIKVKVDNLDSLGNQIRFANRFDDGMIRGGVLGSTQAAVTDLIRVGKFMVDFPKGPLFLARQVGLQLSNPKIEAGTINSIRPISGNSGLTNTINRGIGILNRGVGILNDNMIGPTRIYNLGINTLAQVPVNHLGIHVVRHGFNPIHNDNTNYYTVVRNKQTEDNRLVRLKTRFFDEILLSNQQKNTKKTFLQKLSKALSTNVPSLNANADTMVIDDYMGGPNSTYGIGRTRIRRYDNTLNLTAVEQSLLRAQYVTRNYELNYFKALGVSEYYFGADGILVGAGIDKDNPTKAPSFLNPKNKTFEQIRKEVDLLDDKRIINTRPSGSNGIPNLKTIDWVNSGPGSIVEYKNNQTEETVKIKTVNGWKSLNRETRIGNGRKDSINLTPIFEAGAINSSDVINIDGKQHLIRDFAKFRIEGIRGDNPNMSDWMVFRAYLKSFTDNHTPSWNSTKYIGRGEEFFTYQGYSRRISFQFKVAALSAVEMEPMYQKLNFLASNTAPDYNNDGLMRGSLTRLTIGNYVYREFGFIDSLTYNIADETPWEIAIDEPEKGKMMYELPHIIDVSISFQILHNFLPKKSIGEAPFILYKPAEAITGQGAENIENPWLKERDKDGKYTNTPLRSKHKK